MNDWRKLTLERFYIFFFSRITFTRTRHSKRAAEKQLHIFIFGVKMCEDVGEKTVILNLACTDLHQTGCILNPPAYFKYPSGEEPIDEI